jgi:hypothetical protein
LIRNPSLTMESIFLWLVPGGLRLQLHIKENIPKCQMAIKFTRSVSAWRTISKLSNIFARAERGGHSGVCKVRYRLYLGNLSIKSTVYTSRDPRSLNSISAVRKLHLSLSLSPHPWLSPHFSLFKTHFSVEFSAESEFPAKFLVGKFLLLRCSSNFVLYCFLYYYDEFCWINQNFIFL